MFCNKILWWHTSPSSDPKWLVEHKFFSWIGRNLFLSKVVLPRFKGACSIIWIVLWWRWLIWRSKITWSGVLLDCFIKFKKTMFLTRKKNYIRNLKTNIWKRMLPSPPASLLPRFGRNLFRAGRRIMTSLRVNACLVRRLCQNQIIADSQTLNTYLR